MPHHTTLGQQMTMKTRDDEQQCGDGEQQQIPRTMYNALLLLQTQDSGVFLFFLSFLSFVVMDAPSRCSLVFSLLLYFYYRLSNLNIA